MNKIRIVIISSIVLFCSSLQPASRQRRASYLMTSYQANNCSRSRKFLCYQWLKKKRLKVDNHKNYVGHNGFITLSKREFMSSLAQRRADMQLMLRLGRGKSF